MPIDRTRARALANASVARGDAVGWFDELYKEAQAGETVVPWVDRVANPLVVAWLDRERLPGGLALDVGCGLGDNAIALAERGFFVDAFDVSATAVAAARQRWCAHPAASRITWHVADLLNLPTTFSAYDLIVECYTLQVLPPEPRHRAAEVLSTRLALGGILLVIARGRDEAEPAGEMPWPLTVGEVHGIATPTVKLVNFEELLDDEVPPVRRLRATFRRMA